MHEELRALRDSWRKNADEAEGRVKDVEEYTGIPTTGGPANAWIEASRIHADRLDAILAKYAEWRLPIDVTIGNGTFRKGVPVRMVIERLERQEQYNADDEAAKAEGE